MELSPIILFCYNRPWHTKETLEALENNKLADKSRLFIFSDGAINDAEKSKIDAVRSVIKNNDGFKSIEIIEREKNWGLADNIISGVSQVIKNFSKVIVVEDDLVTSPYFLEYMNSALNYYENIYSVFSISGFNYPDKLMKFPKDYPYDVYCCPRNSSHGWATWADRWELADWELKNINEFFLNKSKIRSFHVGGEDLTRLLRMQTQGKIDSWAIRWTYTHFMNNAVSICPLYSYVNNIGHDNSGTHCRRTNKFYNDLSKAKKNPSFPKTVYFDPKVIKSYQKVHKRNIFYKIARFTFHLIKAIFYRQGFPRTSNQSKPPGALV